MLGRRAASGWWTPAKRVHVSISGKWRIYNNNSRNRFVFVFYSLALHVYGRRSLDRLGKILFWISSSICSTLWLSKYRCLSLSWWSSVLPFYWFCRRITRSLADAMISNQVDLVVVEGMGRVIHTNLHAKFKCDVLKVVTFFPNFSPVVLESYIKYIQVFFSKYGTFCFLHHPPGGCDQKPLAGQALRWARRHVPGCVPVWEETKFIERKKKYLLFAHISFLVTV